MNVFARLRNWFGGHQPTNVSPTEPTGPFFGRGAEIVEARQVTMATFEAVVLWCGRNTWGTFPARNVCFTDRHDRTIWASQNDWIVRNKAGELDVFSNEQFKKVFVPL
jgi:hypothetical protein